MTSFVGDGVKVIDQFKRNNFNLWKFKLEVGLAFVDLWGHNS